MSATLESGRRRRRSGILLSLAAALTVSALAGPVTSASAASDTGCEGGGFSLVLPGSTVTPGPSGELKTTIAANRLGSSFLVKGKYVEFTVVSKTLGVRNWTLTGAPNALDITGGKRTVVFASKTPDHRGASLTSGLDVELKEDGLVIKREGSQVEMKIQSKDCAQGGIFQMEPEREDNTATVFTHTLAQQVFYYDNPNFRSRLGTTVPFTLEDGTVIQMEVPTRVNFGNNVSAKFVGRDSAQVAERLPQCSNTFGTHCGGVSQWSVASGGRMGQVMGEDATEVSPAATDCTTDCQAQNQIRGRATVLGNPFPVPASSRLTPRLP